MLGCCLWWRKRQADQFSVTPYCHPTQTFLVAQWNKWSFKSDMITNMLGSIIYTLPTQPLSYFQFFFSLKQNHSPHNPSNSLVGNTKVVPLTILGTLQSQETCRYLLHLCPSTTSWTEENLREELALMIWLWWRLQRGHGTNMAQAPNGRCVNSTLKGLKRFRNHPGISWKL